MGRFKWDKQYLDWGITAFLVIVCAIAFYLSFSRVSRMMDAVRFGLRVLSPILYGLVFAYLLTPAVRRMEKLLSGVGNRVFPKDEHKAERVVRAVSIVAVLVITLLLVTLLMIMLLPQLYESVENLVRNIPRYVPQAIDFIQRFLDDIPQLETFAVDILESISNYFLDWVENSLLPNVDIIITSVSTGVMSFLRFLLNLFVGIIISIYVMYNREMFAAQAKKLLYSLLRRDRVQAVIKAVKYVDKAFGGFFLGKFVDSAIIGAVTFIFLSLPFIDMPYTALISVIIGVTNMIPFFGPFIGAVPCSLIILLEDPVKCLIFIAFVIVLQQVDGNILGPKILSNTTGLSGFWVMFAILVGGGLFGFIGMICGVPVVSVLYAGVRYLCNRWLTRKDMPTNTLAYVGEVPPAGSPDGEDE